MPDKQRFYIVFRIFIKGEQEVHSMQFFDDKDEAEGRYYNIVAADFGNKDITYFMTFVLDNWGTQLEGLKKVVDRRDFNPPEPEPQPEPTPEPEQETEAAEETGSEEEASHEAEN
jgi:hypothetical protein